MLNRPGSFASLVAVMVVFVAALAGAQEGFPLDGTWRGEWGEADSANHVVLVMKWNGETVTGRINPGPSSIDFDHAELIPEDWTVRIDATSDAGEPIAIEGTLRDIGSYNRSIEGTWTQGGTTYPFRISRE